MGEGILTSIRRWLGGPAIEPAGGPERPSETGWSADAGTVGRIAISADGRLLRVNGAFCRLTGHAEAELLGRRVAEITHPDDRRADAIETDRLLRGDAATFTREKRLVRKDGGVRWATVTARFARGADGAPARIEGEVVDVTDRRRVEEALREQEARYRAMFETAVDAVLVIDARGAIRSANPAVERLFGHAPSELVGRNVSVLMPTDHAGAHDGHLARYAAGAERRIIGIGREVEARRKDGSLFPAELSVAEWEAGGERFYTGTLRDVSARRAAEAATRQERDRAQSYLQVAGVMLLVLDRDGRIETVNQRGAEILGHADPSSLIGRDWFDLAVPPGERDAVRAIFAQFMTGAAEAPERVEGLIRRADGSERLIAWRNTTLRDAQGRIVGTISSGEDVTEARGAEARLRESEARLRFVLESSPDTIFLQDRDLRYVWVVHAAPPFDAEQVLGRTDRELMECPEEAGRLEIAKRRAMEEGRRVEGRLHVRIAGQERHFEEVYEPWRDERGAVVGVVGYSRDVTERALAEERIRQSEAFLSGMLDALPVGVIIADAQGRVLRDNAAHRELWGAVPDPERTNLEQYGEWVGYDPATGRRLAAGDWAMARALVGGETVRGELVECERFGTGERRFFLNNAAPILDGGGRVVAGVVAEQDVTDRMAAERALREAADRVQLAMAAGAIIGTWFWDLTRDRFTIDEQFAQSFGIDPARIHGGLSLAEVVATVHPDDQDGLAAAIGKAIERGGPYAHQYRVRRADGKHYWIEANGRVDKDASGRSVSFPGVLLDVEERRKLAEERDRAMRLLESFIKAVPGVVYAKDRDGRMLSANRGTADLVGKPLAEILGRTDAEFLNDPDQARAVMANDRRIMESGVTEQIEEAVSLPDGSAAVWFSTKAPLRNAEGRIVGLIGSSVDITARKRAEVALRESEERYRNLFDNMTEEVHFWRLERDEAGRIVTWRLVDANPPTLATWGRRLEDIRGRTTDEIFGPGSTEHYRPVVEKVMSEGRPQVYEDFFPALGRHFRFATVPLGEFFITTGADITPQKEAQAALERANETLEQRVAEALEGRRLWAEVIEATDAFIQVVDTEMRFLAINKANADEYERRYGLRPQVGDSVPALLDAFPEEREAVRALWTRALDGESFTITSELGDPAHGRRWYEIKFSPLRDAAGRLIGATQFSYDVTEREARQRELAATQAQLHEAQKLETIGQLTGGVAHDFNNLLTPIVGSLERAHRRLEGDERTQRLVAGGLQAAERARVLVERLLTFARRQTLAARPVDVGGLLDGVQDLVTRSIGPQIRVAIDVAEGLPAALVDPNQLELALLNLAVNARDAMPGGGMLTITAQEETVEAGHPVGLAPGRYVRLSVVDTGTGMDATTLRRAVEPFYSTKGQGRGTGLGLSMVHGLAEQSRGRLVLSSSPGVGTRADVWLPTSAEAAPSLRTQVPEPVPAPRAATILLVDDEELVRAGTADMLCDLGYEVVEAAGGAAALERLRSGHAPDLLVTDHLMPGMTGVELAREARALLPGLPILVVTGYQALSVASADDLPRLAKPFRQADLAACVAELLGDGKVVRMPVRSHRLDG